MHKINGIVMRFALPPAFSLRNNTPAPAPLGMAEVDSLDQNGLPIDISKSQEEIELTGPVIEVLEHFKRMRPGRDTSLLERALSRPTKLPFTIDGTVNFLLGAANDWSFWRLVYAWMLTNIYCYHGDRAKGKHSPATAPQHLVLHEERPQEAEAALRAALALRGWKSDEFALDLFLEFVAIVIFPRALAAGHLATCRQAGHWMAILSPENATAASFAPLLSPSVSHSASSLIDTLDKSLVNRCDEDWVEFVSDMVSRAELFASNEVDPCTSLETLTAFLSDPRRNPLIIFGVPSLQELAYFSPSLDLRPDRDLVSLHRDVSTFLAKKDGLARPLRSSIVKPSAPEGRPFDPVAFEQKKSESVGALMGSATNLMTSSNSRAYLPLCAAMALEHAERTGEMHNEDRWFTTHFVGDVMDEHLTDIEDLVQGFNGLLKNNFTQKRMAHVKGKFQEHKRKMLEAKKKREAPYVLGSCKGLQHSSNRISDKRKASCPFSPHNNSVVTRDSLRQLLRWQHPDEAITDDDVDLIMNAAGGGGHACLQHFNWTARKIARRNRRTMPFIRSEPLTFPAQFTQFQCIKAHHQ